MFWLYKDLCRISACKWSGFQTKTHNLVLIVARMDSYLRIAKDRAEGSSQMCPQGKSIHNKVLLSGGQLHKAGEALEAPEVMMLQVHRHLFSN